MPPGWSPSTLALAVIVVAFTSVSARVCVLGTEPDPADGGRIKLVLPAIDPCTCTEVRLGGHNAYAPPRPDGARFIDICHLKDIIANGLARFYNCVAMNGDGVSTDNPRVSTPRVTTIAPKSNPKVTTDVTGSTPEVTKDTPEPTPSGTTNAKGSTLSGSTFVVSTPADEAPVVSTIPEPTEPPADCQKILDAGQNTSGVYIIYRGDQDMQVYCRMDSGKGYIVFQRRLDGSESFDRTWQEYAEGFGDLTGEFWLGNQKLHSLTGNGGWELVITLSAFDGDEARVRYGEFEIHRQNYWLTVSGFNDERGHAGDSLRRQKFSRFSTRDKDYDNDWENCAEKFHGGWWYNGCGSLRSYINYWFQSNLNGLYYNNATVGDYMGIQWVTWKGKQVSLKGSEMMTRPEIDYPITEPPADCQEILDAGQTTSGVYNIQYAGQNMQVYCRMESGKGFIVFQRRLDGSVSFDRTWQEYAEGFGNLTGEFWLGNQKLCSLTRNWGWELVITLKAFDGDEARVRYEYFNVDSSENNYKLRVNYFSGDAGDSLGSHSRQEFSTPDKDNDNTDGKNCAEKFHGGWWYDGCGSDISENFKSNLNGLYYNNATVADYMGIQWVTWKGKQVSLKGTEMMRRSRW